MTDTNQDALAHGVAAALGVSASELEARDASELVKELAAAKEQRAADYARAQGRVNKRLAKSRLQQAEKAHADACLWSQRRQLGDSLDQALKLADTGSLLRALDILEQSRGQFEALHDDPLQARYRQVRDFVQRTLEPSQSTPNSEYESPDRQPDESASASSTRSDPNKEATPPPEAPPSEDAPTPQESRHPIPSSPGNQAAEGDPHPRESSSSRTAPAQGDGGNAPPCQRLTFDLGSLGRLHLSCPASPVTLGRFKSQHRPHYPLLAAVQMDKSETTRLLRMLSGQHAAFIFSNGNWMLLDGWPGSKQPSTNGVFLNGSRIRNPINLSENDQALISLASQKQEGPLPRFRVHSLARSAERRGPSIFLERLDAFPDHLLLLNGEATLPDSYGSLRFHHQRESGFALGPEKRPLGPDSKEVLAYASLQTSPLEPVFYGRSL